MGTRRNEDGDGEENVAPGTVRLSGGPPDRWTIRDVSGGGDEIRSGRSAPGGVRCDRTLDVRSAEDPEGFLHEETRPLRREPVSPAAEGGEDRGARKPIPKRNRLKTPGIASIW